MGGASREADTNTTGSAQESARRRNATRPHGAVGDKRLAQGLLAQLYARGGALLSPEQMAKSKFRAQAAGAGQAWETNTSTPP